VDSDGNIYVALSGDHQVAKYTWDGTSYELNNSFGTSGKIGKSNQTSGTGNGEFNTPYDVAVTPDGTEILVSDSGNHRIQLFKTSNGDFNSTFGASGSGVGQFNTPKGLTYDGSGYLYIVDSGNNRVAVAHSSTVMGTSGSSGSVLGQFSGAVNLCVGPRGIYVGDVGNNRVQIFDPFDSDANDTTALLNVKLSLSTQFSPSLSQPNAIAPIGDFLAEKIYIADTGNGRVLKVALPEGALPSATWTDMKTSLLGGDITQAASHFSQKSAETYRRSFTAMGSALINSTMNKTITPVIIEGDTAQYYFQDTLHGDTITFPVEFVKENGVWKILEF
jgi:DNA-binding beta-propeller fold protein YncE